jgi:hypothetical protein
VRQPLKTPPIHPRYWYHINWGSQTRKRYTGQPPPTKSVIYAALGLPPRGDPPRFPDTPRALVVVDSRQSGPPSHRHPGRWDSVPEIAPVNPALAAMANALRVGDHLLTRLD